MSTETPDYSPTRNELSGDIGWVQSEMRGDAMAGL